MREQELIVYKDFEKEEGTLLFDMAWLMEHYEDDYYNREDLAGLLYDCMHRLLEIAGNHGFHGNLWHCYLSNLLVNNENSYSRACEIRGEVEGTINQAVLHDIVIFKEFFDYDFTKMTEALQVRDFSLITDYVSSDSESKVYNSRIRERICSLAQKFAKNHTPEEMKATLTEFYKDYGVGRFGLHKAFRVVHDENGVQIVPIQNIAHVYLNDLIGYEIPKKKLIDNTEAFVEGRKANNCLLFGDAGTGKSTSIQALVNEYADQGLRLIELYKEQYDLIPDILRQVKGRNYRFLLFLDDLSFEENETSYKYLKAVMEGGAEAPPENVRICATSNRRHLVREVWSDRGDVEHNGDIHRSDTVEEKLSLASRFGLQIFYPAPTFEEYQQIVSALSEKAGMDLPPEQLRAAAATWQVRSGSRSGRTARQFVDQLEH